MALSYILFFISYMILGLLSRGWTAWPGSIHSNDNLARSEWQANEVGGAVEIDSEDVPGGSNALEAGQVENGARLQKRVSTKGWGGVWGCDQSS